jgi:hypothetical protein
MGQLHEYDDMFDDMDNMPTRFGVTPSLMKSHDEIIQGVPFIATMSITEYEINAATQIINEEYIKRSLVEKLANELFKNKMIEFTRQKDENTETFTFRARIFAVTDDRIRILRTEGVIE